MSDEITDAVKERAKSREKVAADARFQQLSPRLLYSADDLEWAFRGHENDLEELEAEIPRLIAARIDRERRSAETENVNWMTQTVLDEWGQAEQAERRRNATIEARKRLGLPVHDVDRWPRVPS